MSDLILELRAQGLVVCNQAAAEIERLRKRIADLERACDLLLMCSLPRDVSGEAMIAEARELRVDKDSAEE